MLSWLLKRVPLCVVFCLLSFIMRMDMVNMPKRQPHRSFSEGRGNPHITGQSVAVHKKYTRIQRKRCLYIFLQHKVNESENETRRTVARKVWLGTGVKCGVVKVIWRDDNPSWNKNWPLWTNIIQLNIYKIQKVWVPYLKHNNESGYTLRKCILVLSCPCISLHFIIRDKVITTNFCCHLSHLSSS